MDTHAHKCTSLIRLPSPPHPPPRTPPNLAPSTRHGYRTALTPEIVAQLEGHMSALSRHLEDLAVDLYAVSHGAD